jgi:GTP cyclohydrolase II
MPVEHEILHNSDTALLEVLTGDEPPSDRLARIRRRDADLDPLLLGAVASYQNITRNHYSHDFFPGPQARLEQWATEQKSAPDGIRPRLTYVSRQAPRRQRLGSPPAVADEPALQLPSFSAVSSSETSPASSLPATPPASTIHLPAVQALTINDVEVKCMARTRIPTPHGPAFLHLYHNDQDGKEHLAIVIDPAQLAEGDGVPMTAPPIRSQSLDAVWSADETPMDRLIRGAYVGRLGPSSATPSVSTSAPECALCDAVPAPLVRIHSECFTGETIGSQRCDCGEQLDEALRLLAQPLVIPGKDGAPTRTIPGRGAVVYMRQEGRGIGLLEKIKAYNLQDMGHDTVSANLALGHRADQRGYEIAGAILRDLGLAQGVRLLTNNPDKVRALVDEGVRVADRVPMVPRSWRMRGHELDALAHSASAMHTPVTTPGATLIGGGAVHGADFDRYLQTKISRMGHMLSMPSDAMY